MSKTRITVSTTVAAPRELVWNLWTDPAHVVQWNNASDDWHTPKAENDLREGGRFTYTMAARDGSMSFDFGGEFTKVAPHDLLQFVLDDDRQVEVQFKDSGEGTEVVETFEAENMNSLELQEQGWQAILDNFRKHVESQS